MKSPVKIEDPPIKLEKPDPDVMTCLEEQSMVTMDISPESCSHDIEMPLAAEYKPTEPTVKLDHPIPEKKLMPFNSKKILDDARTPTPLQPCPVAEQQGQLCLSCFEDWGKPLNPGERLLDCQATPGHSSCCDNCARKNSSCELVSTH